MKVNFDFLDGCKFFMAIMVVGMHSCLNVKMFGFDVARPWLSLVVPLFFLMSSYFLYAKIRSCPSAERDSIYTFALRNVRLYAFWFVVSFPAILFLRWDEWSSWGLAFAPLAMVKSILFSSTFLASWYISASVVGVFLVYLLSRRFSTAMIVVMSGLIYLLVCMRSSYWALIRDYEVIAQFVYYYEFIFSTGYNSFPVSLFWIACGKWLAECQLEKWHMRKGYLGLLSLLSLVALYLEWHISGIYKNGCFVSLLFACPLLFVIMFQIKISILNSRRLRMWSVIIFCSHGVFLLFVNAMRKFLCIDDATGLGRMSLTVLMCVGCALIIERVEGRSRLLQLSH